MVVRRIITDLQTNGSCCPSASEALDVWVEGPQGPERRFDGMIGVGWKVSSETMGEIEDINENETAIYWPPNMVDRFATRRQVRSEAAFDTYLNDHSYRYDKISSYYMGPVSLASISEVEIRPGERVVDFGAGCGIVGRTIREQFGKSVEYLGIDIDPFMVNRTKAHNLDCELSDASSVDVASGSVDVVMCQQLIQYVDKPVDVLTEARRILRPGGRLQLTVWGDAWANPYLAIQLMLVRELYDERTAEDFASWTTERLGGTAGLLDALEQAGFSEPRVEHTCVSAELAEFEGFLDNVLELGVWAASYCDLNEDRKRHLLTEIRAKVDVDSDGTAHTPIGLVTATGTA